MTRLYTEDVNRDGIQVILSRYVDGYTMIPALGIWKGQKEHSLIIELFDHSSQADEIALELCELNNQDAVAVQHSQAEVHFVSRKQAAA